MSKASSSTSTTKHRRPTLKNLNPLFHKQTKSEDDQILTKSLIKQCQKSGILKLTSKGLSTVPDKVWNINAPENNTVEMNLDTLGRNIFKLVEKEEDLWWNKKALTTLDLSSNVLVTISKDIANLYDLTILDLHDNAVTTIPKEIGQLEKLVKVNLSRNQLKELPQEFFRLRELRVLNLSYNLFEELNPDISDLYMLENMDLSNNQLTSLPGGIGFLVRLTHLICSYNHLKELPADFCSMRSLQKLDLTHNEVKQLPDDFNMLRKLKLFYAQHNDIKELPEDFPESLEEIHLSNNFIEKIPTDFCEHLPHLKILDLRDNKIETIPDEIAVLQNLIRLDLSNNTIKTIPNSLATLASLISLQLDGNPLRSIRRDIIQSGTQRILKTLRDRTRDQQFDNSANMKTNAVIGEENYIFPDKFKIRRNRCLTVTMKNISDVPEQVFLDAKEEACGIIDFSKNKFINIPKSLQHVEECAVEVIFANNQLQTLSDAIFLSRFQRIGRLDISSNQLSDIPTEFGNMKTLRELNLSNNKFKMIPEAIYHLDGLEVLQARDNKIEKIDTSSDGLGNLKRLAILDLANNNIDQVPPTLGNLKNITNLDLNGNRFRQPRHQILEKGTEAIMSYLRDRIPIDK